MSCISLAGVTSGSSACLSVQLDPLLLYHYDIGEKLLSLHTVLHTYMHAPNLYFTMFLISWSHSRLLTDACHCSRSDTWLFYARIDVRFIMGLSEHQGTHYTYRKPALQHTCNMTFLTY